MTEPAPLQSEPSNATRRDVWAWGFLAVFMLMVAAVRWRLLSAPLERDEGEYAYMGKLLLEGSGPYHDAVNMKLPGTSMLYALSMAVFGQSPTGIRAGLLVMTLASMAMLFLAFRRLFSAPVGVTVAGAFGLLGVSFVVFGFAAHATHYVVFFVAAALLVHACDLEKPSPWRALGAGALMGAAVLMKQHAFVFPVLSAGVILASRVGARVEKRVVARDVALCCAGVVLPYLLVLGWVARAGDFSTFWFWTVTYASHYVRETHWTDAWDALVAAMKIQTREYPLLWLGAAAGLAAVFWTRYSLLKRGLALALALLSFAAVVPGFYFRPHYFVVLLPAVGLLFALLVERAVPRLRWLAPTLLLASALWAVVAHRAYYWDQRPDEVVRFVYRMQPFTESLAVGEFVRKNTLPSDTIAVLGSEPQMLFYADRRSATRHIYMYGLTESHPFNLAMQEQVIAEIEAAAPKLIIDVRLPWSWARRENSPSRIFDWMDPYLAQHYVVVAAAQLFPDKPTRYLMGEAAASADLSSNVVVIFKRR